MQGRRGSLPSHDARNMHDHFAVLTTSNAGGPYILLLIWFNQARQQDGKPLETSSRVPTWIARGCRSTQLVEPLQQA